MCQLQIAIFATILFLFPAVHHLAAQEQTSPSDTTCPSWSYNEDIVPAYFAPGYATAIFGDQVNARESPSQAGAVLGILSIGQPVRVVAVDTTRLTINGRTACWHLVAWSDAEKTQKQGWVWGGYLSLAGGGCERQVSFLLGCTEVKKSSDNGMVRYVHEIRVIKDFQLMDKIQLPAVAHGESQIFNFSITPSRGLSNVQNVVHFNWSGAFCGGTQQDFYALWTTADHLQLLPPLESIGEASDAQTEKYIFPDEIADLNYGYPLMLFLKQPENQQAILYLKENSGGDENGASISISISRLTFSNNVWSK